MENHGKLLSWNYQRKNICHEESLAEYEKRRETKLGRLIANREMPILKKANEIMSKL